MTHLQRGFKEVTESSFAKMTTQEDLKIKSGISKYEPTSLYLLILNARSVLHFVFRAVMIKEIEQQDYEVFLKVICDDQ